MDFDQLRTFLEVWRQRSFSRAAERLRITQPAVSGQIRSLEEEVGERLFHRAGGKLSFTPAGRLFEVFAEDVLDRQRHVQLMMAEQRRSPRGEIAVAAQESTSLYVLPGVFAEFKRRYPRVGLKIVRADRSRVVEAVLQREVEFGVVSLPVADNRLEVRTIHRDELVLAAPPEHVLALTDRPATPEEVAAHPMLLLKRGRQRELLLNVFRLYDLQPKAAMELDSGELMKRFVLAGLGIGFMPRVTIAEELRSGQLRLVRADFLKATREMALIFLREQMLTRAAHAFLETAVQHSGEGDAGSRGIPRATDGEPASEPEP